METANYSDFSRSLEHMQNVCVNECIYYFVYMEIFIGKLLLVVACRAPEVRKVTNVQMNPTRYIISSVYNGRTSSLRISGIRIPRPWGVVYEGGTQAPQSKPIWSPSRSVDFELEIGVYLSKTLSTGQVLDIKTAKAYIFGFVIVNDWSARDI